MKVFKESALLTFIWILKGFQKIRKKLYIRFILIGKIDETSKSCRTGLWKTTQWQDAWEIILLHGNRQFLLSCNFIGSYSHYVIRCTSFWSHLCRYSRSNNRSVLRSYSTSRTKETVTVRMDLEDLRTVKCLGHLHKASGDSSRIFETVYPFQSSRCTVRVQLGLACSWHEPRELCTNTIHEEEVDHQRRASRIRTPRKVCLFERRWSGWKYSATKTFVKLHTVRIFLARVFNRYQKLGKIRVGVARIL